MAKKRTALGVALGTLGGASFAFTLMACYGAPPRQACPDGTRDCLKPAPTDSAGTGTTTPPESPDGGN